MTHSEINSTETTSTPLREDRYWVDGCFDFTHHGHAGAIRQARKLANELYVGIHTDEEIYVNKGPVVMKLEERVTAVEACKWCTKSVPGAPYVTDPEVLDSYGCKYVVHGDDITTDADGNDCYQVVKDMGRFVVVKRTPNISTTDLVDRMLSSRTTHHIESITPSNYSSHVLINDEDSLTRFKDYATAVDAKAPWSGVYVSVDDKTSVLVEPAAGVADKLKKNAFYVDGGFDLFFMGHIEFLRLVHEEAQRSNAVVVVGLHDDATVNSVKGENYPIMNQFERALCVLQCKYVDSVVIGAPFTPDEPFINSLSPHMTIKQVLHGPTPIVGEKGTKTVDPYVYVKEQGIYKQIGPHKYDDVSSNKIVDRVLEYREQYEERQRKKGVKAVNERDLEAIEKATAK
ncbi:ethanolamine-phosphate cytidylyltransferase [Sugiyamaella lignohabitans]|uniref:ethanolamine-phosphate cytidylyltransferase n=1 Tax=Sugiyamaella lignohabitans TaxID=796027 RepID=A0A167BY94_9ASCO|nr:ethanolamine-phosphate cytidylyltransferase [Sugiyamaella lignohabitans]ANB10974.1 ethanolamine-phosphate cytidylyltransferase [Sugiyamaella lignohabitans]